MWEHIPVQKVHVLSQCVRMTKLQSKLGFDWMKPAYTAMITVINFRQSCIECSRPEDCGPRWQFCPWGHEHTTNTFFVFSGVCHPAGLTRMCAGVLPCEVHVHLADLCSQSVCCQVFDVAAFRTFYLGRDCRLSGMQFVWNNCLKIASSMPSEVKFIHSIE